MLCKIDESTVDFLKRRVSTLKSQRKDVVVRA